MLDLQTEINNLKREVKEPRQQQEIHQIILCQLEESSDYENTEKDIENENENLEDEMFMGLINKIKIQKLYINIKIIINDFFLDMMALFDTGADSNFILEGLIPTKFFEKTSEKLSTANGSKLKINYKLSNAIIENQGLRINTNFLLIKYLKNEVILGTPFIRAMFPLQISKEGITTTHLGKKITFDFSTKPISRNTNLIEIKINQINFLKEEARSSTQITKKEGSSTQIITIKPESSTQASPKSATAKQTSADYAWSIQTLQALQEMGLTKVPRLTKKTWVDMASESDDDSETNLQNIIQEAKISKTTNSKGKQALTQTQTPPTKQTSSYIYKNKFSTVLQMEPEFWIKTHSRRQPRLSRQDFISNQSPSIKQELFMNLYW
ncbi:hypothetical protein GmHk_18G051665 [Glycine max]|nr:hypothetical protein GmHk_18G051665 [Glycine max]